jgi:hypothetical protein
MAPRPPWHSVLDRVSASEGRRDQDMKLVQGALRAEIVHRECVPSVGVTTAEIAGATDQGWAAEAQ